MTYWKSDPFDPWSAFFFWCIVSKWAINSAGHGGTFTNHLVWVENLRVRRTPLSIVRKIVRADLMKGNVPLCYDWAKTGLIFSINIIANFCLSGSKPIFRGLVNDLFQFLVSSNFTNFHSVFQLGSHGLKTLLLVLYNYPVGPICPNLASYIIKTIQKSIWIRKKLISITGSPTWVFKTIVHPYFRVFPMFKPTNQPRSEYLI